MNTCALPLNQQVLEQLHQERFEDIIVSNQWHQVLENDRANQDSFVKAQALELGQVKGYHIVPKLLNKNGCWRHVVVNQTIRLVDSTHYGVESHAERREAEVEGETANERLGQALEDKKTVIVEKGKEIVKYVDRFKDREVLKTVEGPERVKIEKVIEYVEKCPVPKELVDAHNQAAVPPTGDKK